MEKEPLYRVQREAEEKAAWQDVVNIVRRICCKPILKTADQARQEHLKNNGY
jgi:hypothetical protein